MRQNWMGMGWGWGWGTVKYPSPQLHASSCGLLIGHYVNTYNTTHNTYNLSKAWEHSSPWVREKTSKKVVFKAFFQYFFCDNRGFGGKEFCFFGGGKVLENWKISDFYIKEKMCDQGFKTTTDEEFSYFVGLYLCHKDAGKTFFKQSQGPKIERLEFLPEIALGHGKNCLKHFFPETGWLLFFLLPLNILCFPMTACTASKVPYTWSFFVSCMVFKYYLVMKQLVHPFLPKSKCSALTRDQKNCMFQQWWKIVVPRMRWSKKKFVCEKGKKPESLNSVRGSF